jgi:hypothetical protein
VYGGNALKADVFRPKDVVDMLLDEEEEQDLKERQQKFLRTKRVKGRGRPPGGHGDHQIIDTSSAALKRKESESPLKSLSKPFNLEKPSKKSNGAAGPFKTTSAASGHHIFTTSKSQNQSFGPSSN